MRGASRAQICRNHAAASHQPLCLREMCEVNSLSTGGAGPACNNHGHEDCTGNNHQHNDDPIFIGTAER